MEAPDSLLFLYLSSLLEDSRLGNWVKDLSINYLFLLLVPFSTSLTGNPMHTGHLS